MFHHPTRYRYPWPASALSPSDMALLHEARETSTPRLPITVLIADAIRRTYGQAQPPPENFSPASTPRKEVPQ
jgi:hypothetical protein